MRRARTLPLPPLRRNFTVLRPQLPLTVEGRPDTTSSREWFASNFKMSRRRFPRASGCVWLLLAWLAFTGTRGFAETTYSVVASTPYDRQMSPTLPILRMPTARAAGDTSLATVDRWLLELRVIPYEYSIPWRTPAELASAVVTDCKGKSALLYAKMRSHGHKQIYLVIGKRRAADLKTHAWVEWRTNGGTYVLDPTYCEAARRVRALEPATYIPQYGYDGARKYRLRRISAVRAPALAKK
jgi:hypothetical protein